jgi:hypothetical protein
MKNFSIKIEQTCGTGRFVQLMVQADSLDSAESFGLSIASGMEPTQELNHDQDGYTYADWFIDVKEVNHD